MNMFGSSKYVVVAGTVAIGPFASKAEAVEHGVSLIQRHGIDTFSSREELVEGLEHNTRNDVSVVAFVSPRAALVTS